MGTEGDIATLKEQYLGLRRDFDRMQANNTWLWRAVVGFFGPGIVAALWLGISNGTFTG